MTAEDRHEATRQVMRQMGIGRDWLAVADPDIPAHLMELITDALDAWERLDLDALIATCDPSLEIRQPREFPDAQTYTGPDALVDSLLDWPRQWDDFRMEPRRVFAPDNEHIIVVTVHRGRPRSMDMEVEAEITFLLRYRDGLNVEWDMFLSVDDALRKAAERRADGDDDRAAERDGGERAQEAGAEEARADHG